LSDETTKVTAEEGAPPAEAIEVNPVEEYFRTASPDEIMKNDRIRGILGSRLQAEREKIRKDLGEEQDKAAREKAEADLIELARWQPQQFAEKYLTDYEQKKIQKDLDALKDNALSEIAGYIGEGYRDLPEFQNLTTAELEKLNAAVVNKSHRDAIKGFNAAALDVIAERRANAKLATYRETELPKEREAARQEAAATRLKQGARPTLTRAPAPTEGNGWQDLPPGPDFNKAYEQHVLGRRR
jgi:hypothetical protein